MINLFNLCGEYGIRFAGDMLIQSSILIAVLFAIDWAIKSRARAVFRYSLGLLVLVKLALPPSLAVPTGVGYWLAKETQATPKVTITHSALAQPFHPAADMAAPIQSNHSAVHLQQPSLTLKGGAFALWLAGMAGLATWIFHRSRLIARMISTATEAPPFLNDLAKSCSTQLEITHPLAIKICSTAQSPALSGLFQPTILIPGHLVQQLTEAQMKAVLLHELVHFKRHDLLVNHAQTLLQVAYWWHPLLWLANGRLQRLREEAVDETVMVSMQKDADIYPETLLTVAKFAFTRPLLTLGMVGIIESKSALKKRIRRVIEMEIPKSEKLHASRLLLLIALAALLLPMAQAAPRIIATSDSPTDLVQPKEPVQFQFEVQYIEAQNNESLTFDVNEPRPKTAWMRKQDLKSLTLISPKYTTTEGDQLHIEVPDGPQLDIIPSLASDRHVYLSSGPVALNTAFVTLTASTSHNIPSGPIIATGTPFVTASVSTGHNNATDAVHVTQSFETTSGETRMIALETNTPCRRFILFKTTIIKTGNTPEKAKAITVLQPFGQYNPSNSFPVLTAASVEKQIASDGGKFTIETAVKILKKIEYTSGKTVGFDRTFLNHFQDKGPTLFMAGAMVINGNENHVEGIVEPVSSRSKTRTRTFHVDFNLFKQNVEARHSKDLSPGNLSWPDILKVLFEEAGLDCDSGNKISFNENKGEITVSDSQNIDTVERLLLDLNQPANNSRLWLPVFINQRELLTQALFIELTDAAFNNLQLKPERRTDHQIGDFYSLDSKTFAKAQDYLGNNGSVLSRPRIQSASGVPCSLFVSDEKGSLELSLVNYVFGKKMKTSVLGRTTGTFSTKSSDWPDGAGQTNVAIYAHIPISTNGGVLFRVRNSTTNPTNNLALLLKVSVVK